MFKRRNFLSMAKHLVCVNATFWVTARLLNVA
jgi:hypothetical protein